MYRLRHSKHPGDGWSRPGAWSTLKGSVDMTDLIRALVLRARQVLQPTQPPRGRHRRGLDGPLDGTATRLVRPYVLAYEGASW